MVLLAESFFHTFDPFAIQFSQGWGIRWYGLSYAAGFLIAWWFVRWMARTGRTPIPLKAAGDLMFYIILGVLLGGRIGYALFYDRALFLGFTNSVPFWDLLAINKGGMASHGGIIGVVIACLLFARKHRVPPLHLCDIAALGCTPGLFLGRLANFVNGELMGFPVADQANPPWWSVKFTQDMLEWPAERLSTLRDVVAHIGVDAQQWVLTVNHMASDAPARNFVYDTIHELITATQNGDQQIIADLRPLLDARYPSQLFQAITDGPLLALPLALIWLKPRKPGVVGSWFLIIYGVLRIATEHYRMPDQGVPLLLGLSRGRVLSVIMILAGVAVLAWLRRRNVPPLGGLLRSVHPHHDGKA
jgi:phosphatidylglycerol---prolipoprotein diacylglyceryl transferase